MEKSICEERFRWRNSARRERAGKQRDSGCNYTPRRCIHNTVFALEFFSVYRWYCTAADPFIFPRDRASATARRIDLRCKQSRSTGRLSTSTAKKLILFHTHSARLTFNGVLNNCFHCPPPIVSHFRSIFDFVLFYGNEGLMIFAVAKFCDCLRTLTEKIHQQCFPSPFPHD